MSPRTELQIFASHNSAGEGQCSFLFRPLWRLTQRKIWLSVSPQDAGFSERGLTESGRSAFATSAFVMTAFQSDSLGNYIILPPSRRHGCKHFFHTDFQRYPRLSNQADYPVLDILDRRKTKKRCSQRKKVSLVLFRIPPSRLRCAIAMLLRLSCAECLSDRKQHSP